MAQDKKSSVIENFLKEVNKRKDSVYGDNSLTVLGPNDDVNGLTQAQLGDEWWKTVYQIPLAEHFGAFDDMTRPQRATGINRKSLGSSV